MRNERAEQLPLAWLQASDVVPPRAAEAEAEIAPDECVVRELRADVECGGELGAEVVVLLQVLRDAARGNGDAGANGHLESTPCFRRTTQFLFFIFGGGDLVNGRRLRDWLRSGRAAPALPGPPPSRSRRSLPFLAPKRRHCEYACTPTDASGAAGIQPDWISCRYSLRTRTRATCRRCFPATK